jgi:hypothetical protein
MDNQSKGMVSRNEFDKWMAGHSPADRLFVMRIIHAMGTRYDLLAMSSISSSRFYVTVAFALIIAAIFRLYTRVPLHLLAVCTILMSQVVIIVLEIHRSWIVKRSLFHWDRAPAQSDVERHDDQDRDSTRQ